LLSFECAYEDVGFLKRRADALPVPAPRLVLFNDALGASFGINPAPQAGPLSVARFLVGADLPASATPCALAYAGHQFGHFVPQLGDGRALLLGAIPRSDGRLFDVQLKGSGPTVFSRGGDGLLQLGPALREFIVSEAMAHLGIATTRVLSVVATGEALARQSVAEGAVIARIARSHLRIGSFEYTAVRHGVPYLKALITHTLKRLYPSNLDLAAPYAELALHLFRQVANLQMSLVAQWLGVGFIHGVMNTDNVALSGETLDYGPCAFMDTFRANRVFSSIDSHGRYAYNNQLKLLLWNLARFAESLLPVLVESGMPLEEAQERFNSLLQEAAAFGESERIQTFRRKIGCHTTTDENDKDLIQDLLQIMEEESLDFTNTFRRLSDADGITPVLKPWVHRWEARLAQEHMSRAVLKERLLAANPAVIPRNHRVEEAIVAANAGDLKPCQRLLSAVRKPFETTDQELEAPPGDDEWQYKTFCGT